jgi:amino acid transporter
MAVLFDVLVVVAVGLSLDAEGLASMVGGSRAVQALAHSNMLPRVLAKLHPQYNTPVNAIFLISILSALVPFFGRPMLVWCVNGGSFAILRAYIGIAISWLLLPRREPEMAMPLKSSDSNAVG